jgi:hypothetical protein
MVERHQIALHGQNGLPGLCHLYAEQKKNLEDMQKRNTKTIRILSAIYAGITVIALLAGRLLLN